LEKNERKRGAGMILFIILLIAFVCFIGYKYFRVAKIEIEGNVNIEENYIAYLSGIEMDENLFAINVDKVESYINSDPYLEFFDLKRVYPSTVRVEVYERITVALVLGENKNYILDKEGNVLESITGMRHDLIIIKGISLLSAKAGEKIATENAYEFDALIGIIRDVKFDELSEIVTGINFRDINNIVMDTNIGFDIEFGQAEKVSDKIIWIDAVVKELIDKNIKRGTINVTSGDFATYKEAME